ncbi:MAG: hypothetical protein VB959_04710 [Rhodospirillales bacterium]
MRDDISSDAAIARLIEKAEADDWTPATAIDWNLKIGIPFGSGNARTAPWSASSTTAKRR